MMRFVILALACIASLVAPIEAAAALPHMRMEKLVIVQPQADVDVNNVLNVVRGFAAGLQTILQDNGTACVQLESTILSDLETTFAEFKEGIDHLSPSEIDQALVTLAKAITEISTVMEKCGVEHLVSSLRAIATELESGPEGWLKFVAEEVLNVLSHKTSLAKDIREAINSWNADPRDYYHSGYYTGAFVAILIENQPTLWEGRLQKSTQTVGGAEASEDFLIGFGLGLGSTLGNAKCAQDVTTAVEAIDSAFTQIHHECDHLSVHGIEDGLRSLAPALVDVYHAVDDCGVAKFVEDVRKVAELLAGGPESILELLAKELLGGIVHHTALRHNFDGARAAFEADDWRQAGYYSGAFTAIILDDA